MSMRRHEVSQYSFFTSSNLTREFLVVSFSTILGSVHSLVNSVSQVQEEAGILEKMQLSLPGDRFGTVMDVSERFPGVSLYVADVNQFQGFVKNAEPAIAALKVMGNKLEVDLKVLLQYYGEDPLSSKPEDLFGVFATFSSSLLVSFFAAKYGDQ